jgi:Tol biopolymer transport system component
MTLDTRARRAAQGIRQAVEVMEMSTSTKEPRVVERFDRFRDRKQHNRRVGALLVAAMLAIAAIVAVTNELERRDKVPVTPPAQNGRIVFGEQDNRNGSNHLFTMNPDGTDVRDLSVEGRCISWVPNGSKILIGVIDPSTNETVRLATINPDGTGYTELDANGRTQGCGAFSPDGTRIVLGGSTELEPNHYYPREHGIFTVRASDGGDLVRLTPRNGTNPNYSPDGSQVVFEGVQAPGRRACYPHSPGPKGGSYTCPPGTYRIGDFDGSVFVVNADGTGLHRIASNMGFLHSSPPSWSPDGRWILFSAGYVAHPDGTGLRRITLESVPRVRAADYPSWSPDGSRFVFVGWTGSDRYNLFTARADGTGVEQITHTHGIYYRSTDWGTNAS